MRKSKLMKFIGSLLFIILFLALIFLLFQRSVPQLPAPTGPYAVGITSYHLIDSTRKESRSSNSDDQRELMVSVFYPAQSTDRLVKSPYIPPQALEVFKEDLNKFVGIPLKKLKFFDTLKTNAVENAELVSKEPSYPLVIFSAGFGSPIQVYLTLLEDLASHGYIVAAINHPYISNPTVFPDGRVIQRYTPKSNPTPQEIEDSRTLNTQTWIADTQFVIGEFEKINQRDSRFLHHIDVSHIGVFGHSFGGTIAIDVCILDKRCTAGIDLDGKPSIKSFIPENFNKPFMFLIAEKSEVPEIQKVLMDFWHKMGPESLYVRLKGAAHGSFGDYMIIAPPLKDAPLLKAKRGITVVRAAIRDFFDMYLKNKKSTVLFGGVHPELEVASRSADL